MTETVNHAICELDSDAHCACLQFQKNHLEMKKLEREYYRYRELAESQIRLRGRIMKIYAVLGRHFSFNSPDVGKLINPMFLSPSDFRKKHLKTWEILELVLSAVNGKITAADVEEFLDILGIDEVSGTPQAIESAVKAHPELFQEVREGRSKFYLLRTLNESAI